MRTYDGVGSLVLTKEGGLEHIDHGRYAVPVTEINVPSSDMESGIVRTCAVQFMLAETESQLILARVARVRVERVDVDELTSSC